MEPISLDISELRLSAVDGWDTTGIAPCGGWSTCTLSDDKQIIAVSCYKSLLHVNKS